MKKLNKNQFALFVADIIKEIKNYNYDVFYDVILFDKEIKETEKEDTQKSFFCYIRDSGTHICEADNLEFINSVQKAFEHTKIFKLTFHKEEYRNNFEVVTIKKYDNVNYRRMC